MKYMLLSDLKNLKKYTNYFIIYYSFIVINLMLLSKYGIYESLALNFKFDGENQAIMEFLLYMFEMLLIIYLSLIVYFKDTKNNAEILFLRMSVQKWITTKILNITIIIGLTIILKYGLALTYCIYNNINIDYLLFVSNLVKNTLYCITITIIALTAVSCVTNKKLIPISIGLFIGYYICATKYSITDIPILVLLLSVVILTLIINFILKKVYINVFEYARGG
jgi:hypothetical protein